MIDFMVPGGGVEPPRGCPRRILSPLRLPVPPSRRWVARADQLLMAVSHRPSNTDKHIQRYSAPSCSDFGIRLNRCAIAVLNPDFRRSPPAGPAGTGVEIQSPPHVARTVGSRSPCPDTAFSSASKLRSAAIASSRYRRGILCPGSPQLSLPPLFRLGGPPAARDSPSPMASRGNRENLRPTPALVLDRAPQAWPSPCCA